MTTFKPGLMNAWVLSLPFFLLVAVMAGTKRDAVKRMSDMTGFTRREKAVTIAASVSPYPFMIATVWTPFASSLPLLYLGFAVYIVGMVFSAAAIRTIIRTPHDKPFTAGPYRFSRNPMYVSATAVFAGICLVTANPALSGCLIAMIVLQHSMILAEERMCRVKYGRQFEDYVKAVPRYVGIVKI